MVLFRASLISEALHDGIKDGGDHGIEEGQQRVSGGIVADLGADVDKDGSAIEEGDHYQLGGAGGEDLVAAANRWDLGDSSQDMPVGAQDEA